MSAGLRGPVARALALGLLGALLLGAAAALLSLRNYPLYESGAQIRLLADPVVGDEVVVPDGSNEENFVDTELVTLNGPVLREEVRQVTGLDDLTVEAVQVGTSNVVEVTTRSSDEDVLTAPDIVVRRYVEGRRTELLTRINSVGTEVDRQLQTAGAEIRRIGDSDSVTAQVQRSALTTEYTRLLEQRNTLQVASDASERLIQNVRSAQLDGAEQVVNPGRNAALGALTGAVLGLSAGLGLTRLRTRLRSLDDLVQIAPEIALPTLPALSSRTLAVDAGVASGVYVSALTRTGHGFGQPPLVVVAPTVGCGASTVAVGLAVASARRERTVLLAAGDVLDGEIARLLQVDTARRAPKGSLGLKTSIEGLTYLPVAQGTGPTALAALDERLGQGMLADARRHGAAIVVDAPALDRSSAGLELARQSGQVLLVGGLDMTTPAELHAASHALRRVGAEVVGVVLSRPRSRPRWGRAGR